MRGLTVIKLAMWACVALIVVLSWLPGQERPHTGLAGPIEHVIAYAGVAGLFGLGLGFLRRRWQEVAFLVALAALLELGQRWIPGRDAKLIDVLASSLGAFVGMAAGISLLGVIAAARRLASDRT